MKVKIRYEYEPRHEPYRFAKAEFSGTEIIRAGYTWEQARERIIAAIREHQNIVIGTIPEDEEVTI